MSGRKNQRGRGAAYHQTANRLRDKLESRNQTNEEKREKPPPGLRGREIGMWYAAQSWKQRGQNRENYLVKFTEIYKALLN